MVLGHGLWQQRFGADEGILGRALADGSDVVSTQSEVDLLARALATEYPDTNTDLAYRVEPMSEPVVDGIRPALQTILFGVGLVLLIAVANVGGSPIEAPEEQGPFFDRLLERMNALPRRRPRRRSRATGGRPRSRGSAGRSPTRRANGPAPAGG